MTYNFYMQLDCLALVGQSGHHGAPVQHHAEEKQSKFVSDLALLVHLVFLLAMAKLVKRGYIYMNYCCMCDEVI